MAETIHRCGQGEDHVYHAPFASFPVLTHHSHPYYSILNAYLKFTSQPFTEMLPEHAILREKVMGIQRTWERMHHRSSVGPIKEADNWGSGSGDVDREGSSSSGHSKAGEEDEAMDTFGRQIPAKQGTDFQQDATGQQPACCQYDMNIPTSADKLTSCVTDDPMPLWPCDSYSDSSEASSCSSHDCGDTEQREAPVWKRDIGHWSQTVYLRSNHDHLSFDSPRIMNTFPI
jgi:hypothetical protein